MPFQIIRFFCFFITTAIWAQDQIEPAGTNAENSIQIEAFGAFTYDENESPMQSASSNILFRYGLTSDIELQLSNQYDIIEDNGNEVVFSGWNDLNIGAKYYLYENESATFGLGVLGSISIPSENETIGYSTSLLISQKLNKLELGYNLTYSNSGIGEGSLAYVTSINVPIKGKFGTYLELFGEFSDLKTHQIAFDTGINLFVSDSIQLDVSYGRGINYKQQYGLFRINWVIDKGTRQL
ncbi:transporter [Spongiivirga citrea]|uniref:Transporter n=1 Tax=Spongiivirga citrea TaxID=1481457 RepID=A0A6M0CM74_9FLAO|nr:transporter [Spongiivirga citrea]NER19048.1 hypothetical protein [Spongiivirga citrea]